MEFVIVLVVLAVVVFVITGPLRREYSSRSRLNPREGEAEAGAEAGGDGEATDELSELEAARDAKYRELRDAELDHRTGKLSDADFEAVDQVLRAEAIEILNQLERIWGAEQPAADAGGPENGRPSAD